MSDIKMDTKANVLLKRPKQSPAHCPLSILFAQLPCEPLNLILWIIKFESLPIRVKATGEIIDQHEKQSFSWTLK